MNSEHKTVSKKIRTKLNDTEFLNINISHGSLFLGTMFGVVLSLLAGSDRIQFTLIRRKTRSDNTCEWVCCDEVEQWSTGWIPDLQAVLKAAVSWCNRFAEVSRDGRDGMPYWRRDPGKPSPFFNISWRKTPEEAARQLLIVDTPESQPGKCAMCGHAHDAGNCAQCPCTTARPRRRGASCCRRGLRLIVITFGRTALGTPTPLSAGNMQGRYGAPANCHKENRRSARGVVVSWLSIALPIKLARTVERVMGTSTPRSTARSRSLRRVLKRFRRQKLLQNCAGMAGIGATTTTIQS